MRGHYEEYSSYHSATAALDSVFSSSVPTLPPTILEITLRDVGAISTTQSSTASSPPSTQTTSSSDPNADARVSTPVAMIAGILAGTIAIVAAVLVLCVVRRKNNGTKTRRRHRASVLRDPEARNPPASGGEHSDDEEAEIEESVDYGRHRSLSRSSSERRRSLQHSVNHGSYTGSRRSGSRQTSRPTVSKNNFAVEGIELSTRSPKSNPHPQNNRTSLPTSRGPHPPAHQLPLSGAMPIPSTDIPFPEPTFPGTNTGDSRTLPPSFPVVTPAQIMRIHSKGDDEDLPPAYDDVR